MKTKSVQCQLYQREAAPTSDERRRTDTDTSGPVDRKSAPCEGYRRHVAKRCKHYCSCTRPDRLLLHAALLRLTISSARLARIPARSSIRQMLVLSALAPSCLRHDQHDPCVIHHNRQKHRQRNNSWFLPSSLIRRAAVENIAHDLALDYWSMDLLYRTRPAIILHKEWKPS